MQSIIIFGATGDLTKRKLIPALYRLFMQGKLEGQIIAVGRRPYNDEDIRREVKEFIKDAAKWDAFSKLIIYHRLEFHDSAAYESLKKRITSENRLFYLATAPESFPVIIAQLSKSGIAEKKPRNGWHRVVFEKPFGHDLPSAQKLNKAIMKLFEERQVYRIDHYLGKELVQNILVLRATNPFFENLWNAKYIDSVQLVVVETEGVLDRGEYYDKAGALRDFVQNHLLQMLALVAMELPKDTSADAIRSEKVKILKKVVRDSVRALKKNVVLGQYTAAVNAGMRIPDYTKEKNVPPSSNTDTFAAVKVQIASTRWKNVPFYLRTGKALMHKYAEIVIVFKAHPCDLFCDSGTRETNKLAIRIQPDEGIKLQFNLKELGEGYKIAPVTMDFSHMTKYGINTSEAYERLLNDVIRGDQTLFTRWDEVAQAWSIIDNIRKAKLPVEKYPAGSHGPIAALKLMTRDGRDWYGNNAVKRLLDD